MVLERTTTAYKRYGRFVYRWLKYTPHRNTARIFVELGYDDQFLYLALGKLVLMLYLGKIPHRTPAKVLEFKK